MATKKLAIDLEKETKQNVFFRNVLLTTPQLQIVLMSLPFGTEIPLEVHPRTTQTIHVESGKASAVVNGKKFSLRKGDCLVIPPRASHLIANSGSGELKLFTIYAPPEHDPNLKQMRSSSLSSNESSNAF